MSNTFLVSYQAAHVRFMTTYGANDGVSTEEEARLAFFKDYWREVETAEPWENDRVNVKLI